MTPVTSELSGVNGLWWASVWGLSGWWHHQAPPRDYVASWDSQITIATKVASRFPMSGVPTQQLLHTETHVDLHVMYPSVCLSNLNQNLNAAMNCSKAPQHSISRRTFWHFRVVEDRQMHKKTNMMKLIVTYLQLLIENPPKKTETVKYFQLATWCL